MSSRRSGISPVDVDRLVARPGCCLDRPGPAESDRELLLDLAIGERGRRALDPAISVAIGSDCSADIAQVRSEPAPPHFRNVLQLELFSRHCQYVGVYRSVDSFRAYQCA